MSSNSHCTKNEEILHGKLHFLCSVRKQNILGKDASLLGKINKTRQLSRSVYKIEWKLVFVDIEKSRLQKMPQNWHLYSHASDAILVCATYTKVPIPRYRYRWFFFNLALKKGVIIHAWKETRNFIQRFSSKYFSY